MRRIQSALKIVVLVITLILSFAFSSEATAETVKGRIKKVDNTYLLVTKNQIAYTLEFTNIVSEQQIKRLESGDFASVTASFSNVAPSLIYVNSVDYVGLDMLIGVWMSDAGLCYEFSTFTRLFVYSPNALGECLRSKDSNEYGKYTYFINPDVDAWNMLISSNASEFVGNLDIFSDTQVIIELFDTRTDVTLGTIVLRR